MAHPFVAAGVPPPGFLVQATRGPPSTPPGETPATTTRGHRPDTHPSNISFARTTSRLLAAVQTTAPKPWENRVSQLS